MESEEAEMHFSLNGSLLLSGEGVFQVYFSFFLTLFLFLRGFFLLIVLYHTCCRKKKDM